ncbi:MAG TPA: PLP-dependent aspartate aminotransferase family protein [Flavobacteriaceae bacterium]|jgi:cystathionine beta-lyase|nr:PLP-dependent aspartate aminotransferase family protein [Flavobacteriaceae bacterium]HJO70295.1 PLP-dependent aspartate aminotransferase family protein [Flavobacteriaceae bacterium]|tara:strand:- start:8243 stop:9406 length:1164 start_codon:yes stop_codon:yes gene_type:complete
MVNKSKKFSTKCVHEGEIKDTMYQGIGSPLFMSTTYPWYGGEDAEKKPYPRYFNTPNQEFLSKKIAALENGEKALIFTSGMAAISTSIMANVKSGDHLIFQEDLYGGTRNFIKTEFDKYGIEYSFAKGLDSNHFSDEIKDNTVGIYIESPSNPLLKIVDLKAISSIANQKSIWTMIDNTFASPVNQNPINHGIDIVIHSATKYLGGHSDICAGAVISTNSKIEKILDSAKNFGGNLSDYTVWLLERSMKTLHIRVKEQTRNAKLLAKMLNKNDNIITVYYPGLSSHPSHDIAKSQMNDFGAMMSFDLKENVDVYTFLESLEIIKPAMSLAGVETTVNFPMKTSHGLLTQKERDNQGIGDKLIRLSVGIEDYQDLYDDLDSAIKKSIK